MEVVGLMDDFGLRFHQAPADVIRSSEVSGGEKHGSNQERKDSIQLSTAQKKALECIIAETEEFITKT